MSLLPHKKLPSQLATCLFKVSPYVPVGHEAGKEIKGIEKTAVKEMLGSYIGKDVTFGTKIILEHFLTDHKMRFAPHFTSSVTGAWPIYLQKEVDKFSVLVVEQTDISVPEDTAVSYETSLNLRFVAHGSASRLMCQDSEVVAGKEIMSWKLHRFQGTRNTPEQVMLGLPIILRLKTLNFYIGVNSSQVKYIDFYNPSALWTLVSQSVKTGGHAKPKTRYYLRNLEFGKFVGKSWSLEDDVEDALLFSIMNLSEGDDDLEYDDKVKIRVYSEKVEESEESEEIEKDEEDWKVPEDLKVEIYSIKLGIDKRTNQGACLATVNPSAYVSHQVNPYDIAVDTSEGLVEVGVFQITRFEDSPTQLLLYSAFTVVFRDFTSSVKPEFDTVKTALENDSFKEKMEHFIGTLNSIKSHSVAIKTYFFHASIKDRVIFIKLRIPKFMTDLFVTFNTMMQEIDTLAVPESASDSTELVHKTLKDVYESISEALIEMMETDLTAREQVKENEGPIVAFVRSETKFSPRVFKMSHDRIEKGVNPEAWVKAIADWLPFMDSVTDTDAIFQDLVLSILHGALLTLGRTNLDLKSLVEVFEREKDRAIFKLHFVIREQVVYADLFNESTWSELVGVSARKFTKEDAVFLAISDIVETNGWSEGLIQYTATLLMFYDSCYQVLGPELHNQLFPHLGLTNEVLFNLSSQPHSSFRIRTAALNMLSKLLTVAQPCGGVKCYNEVDVLAFSLRLESSLQESKLCRTEQGAMVLKYLAAKELPSDLKNAAVDKVLLFVSSIISFGRAIVESRTETSLFQASIQRCVIWALCGTFNYEVSGFEGNWLATLIADQRTEGSHMLQVVNTVLTALFQLLLATVNNITETFGQLILAKFSNMRNKASERFLIDPDLVLQDLTGLLNNLATSRQTATYPELQAVPPLKMLREVLFMSVTYSLRFQFSLTPEIFELLKGVFAPIQTTLNKFQTIIYTTKPIDYVESFRKEIKRDTFEADVISQLDLSNTPEIVIIENEYLEIMKQIKALENSKVKVYLKTIIWDEKLTHYLLLWDRVYGHINNASASDYILKPLHRLGAAIFYMFKLLIADDSARVKELLERFKPYLYYLSLVDEAWLIKEFNNYQNITPKHAIVFLQYLTDQYYKRSILRSGAFLWVEALLVNSDGSVKKDIQNAVYVAFSKLGYIDNETEYDSTGSFAVYLKMLTLCAYRNRPIRSLLQALIPMDMLKKLLDYGRPDIADAVLLILARVHAAETFGTDETISLVQDILEKVLNIAQGVFDVDDFSAFLPKGYYDQVRSKVNLNCKGWYYEDDEHELASLLQLISSGQSPGPCGGITACIGVVLSAFYTSKLADSVKARFKSIAERYQAFLVKYLRYVTETEERLRDQCDFTPLISAVTKALEAIEKRLKFVKAVRKEYEELTTHAQTQVLSEPTSFPDSEVLLSPGLIRFTNALLERKSRKMEFVTNLFTSVKKRVSTQKIANSAAFIKIMDDLMALFGAFSREKYAFTVLKELLRLFEPSCFKECYRKVFTLITSRLLLSTDYEEISSAVEFYEAFGDLKDSNRYRVLLNVLNYRHLGSKLLAKMHRAFTVEARIRDVIADNPLNRLKSLTGVIRKAKLRRFVNVRDFSKVIKQHHQVVLQYLSLLTSWCEDANTPMQLYMADQNTSIGVNIVSEVTGFVTGMLEQTFKHKNFSQNQEMVLAALECLCEFVSGPCVLNQTSVGTSVKLFLSLKTLSKLQYDKNFRSGTSSADPYLAYRFAFISLLDALLEGTPPSEVMHVFDLFFDPEDVVNYATNLYFAVIQPNRRALELGLGGALLQKDAINYAMSAIVVIVRYQSLTDLTISDLLLTSAARTAFSDFYIQYIGYVEIYRPKEVGDTPSSLRCINAIWFLIPFKCKFLTPESALQLIVNVDHSSQQDKMFDFLNQVEPLDAEMVHQRWLSGKSVIKNLTRNWSQYQDLATLLVVAIVLYLLFEFKEPRVLDYSLESDVIMIQVFGIVQMVLYLLGHIGHMIEQYPQMTTQYASFLPNLEMDTFIGLRHHDAITRKYVSLFKDKQESLLKLPKVVSLMTNYYALKTFLYLGASGVALKYPLLFPFLLVGLAESKPEIRNIFRAITQNWTQLVMTAIFGAILIYIFSVFSFTYFADAYSYTDTGAQVDTLYDCFMSTLNLGLRTGGGIASILQHPEDTNTEYWGLLVFDIFFFITINILILNLVFGIIISTFGQLRDDRTALYREINNKCYMCGVDRSETELYAEGWQYHFQVEHSLYAYLAFLIRILDLEKTGEEMSGVQYYVLQKYKARDSTFLPLSSRLIEQQKEGE